MRLLLVLATSLTAVGVFAFGPQTPNNSRALAAVDSAAFTCPLHYTDDEIKAFTEARLKGLPLPDGWAVTQMDGRVTVTDPGVVKAGTSERSWSVTIVDDSVDLARATFSIDGKVVFTATRDKGAIVDRSGVSTATLPVLVPPKSQSWNGKVR
jgi:hypothetical protein